MHVMHARRILAVLLVLCLLVVSGLASAQSITHESQHAHHQKATHSTVLCSWMCAASHVHDGTAALVLVEQPPVSLFESARNVFVPCVALDSAVSRGPPPTTSAL
ncbi:MAG: hypothetical protein ICV75_08270 [Nitrospiraceae bacterium]|nr:hypothetical protein [Nitrospiraceae bacterium]